MGSSSVLWFINGMLLSVFLAVIGWHHVVTQGAFWLLLAVPNTLVTPVYGFMAYRTIRGE